MFYNVFFFKSSDFSCDKALVSIPRAPCRIFKILETSRGCIVSYHFFRHILNIHNTSQCVQLARGHTSRKMVGEHISEADGGSQCVGGSDKRRTLLIPSLSPAAMVVLVLVQADLWADWSVMTTPPLWFQRLPCTVSFSSPWSPSSASSKFNVWVWRCFLNAPVLYHKGDKNDDDSEDMTDMTDHTKQTKYDMIAWIVCVNHLTFSKADVDMSTMITMLEAICHRRRTKWEGGYIL